MIVRTWSGATRSSDADRYTEYMRETGLKAYRATAGNLGAILLRRPERENTRFLFISFWESLDSVRAFAGEDHERAVFYPEDERFLVDKDLDVQHYEVALSDIP